MNLDYGQEIIQKHSLLFSERGSDSGMMQGFGLSKLVPVTDEGRSSCICGHGFGVCFGLTLKWPVQHFRGESNMIELWSILCIS